jgi:hypothetical protein
MRPGINEPERQRTVAILEQMRPGARHDRMDKQLELVEQTRLEQEPHQGAAGPAACPWGPRHALAGSMAPSTRWPDRLSSWHGHQTPWL